MISPFAIVANFACLLHLARHHPEAEAELAEATRVFLASLRDSSVTFEATSAWLAVGGRRLPSASPGVRDVNEHMFTHGVSRLTLPTGPAPADVEALARALSAYPGRFASWEELVGSLGGAAERLGLVNLGSDVSFIRLNEGEEDITLHAGDEGDVLSGMHAPQMLHLEDPDPVPPPMPVGPGGPGARLATNSKREDPGILADLVERGRAADGVEDYQELLHVLNGFLEAEKGALSASGARVYRMELKRLVTRRHLSQFARMAAAGRLRELAIRVLRELGPDAAETLMEQLVEADTMAERRGYYSALSRMDEGREIIVHYLGHPAWYVVRNAADLCGEMGLAQAVPHLARLADHPDERVRKSVAVALARINAPETIEPLGRMAKDPSPAIRVQVLGNLDGSRARSLAMPLAAMLESENHPEVLRELLRALGRMGTPDALVALHRVARGEFGRLGRRLRGQAVEAIAVAGAAGEGLLRTLSQDPHPDIRAAATRALEGMTT